MWISEIFNEDNASLRRRSPRLGIVSKALKSIPQALAFAFCNFASAYSRAADPPTPQPVNEIHRICSRDAVVEIHVPTLMGPYAAADPTHVRLFNARTLSYFEPGSSAYGGIEKGSKSSGTPWGFQSTRGCGSSK